MPPSPARPSPLGPGWPVSQPGNPQGWATQTGRVETGLTAEPEARARPPGSLCRESKSRAFPGWDKSAIVLRLFWVLSQLLFLLGWGQPPGDALGEPLAPLLSWCPHWQDRGPRVATDWQAAEPRGGDAGREGSRLLTASGGLHAETRGARDLRPKGPRVLFLRKLDPKWALGRSGMTPGASSEGNRVPELGEGSGHT